MKKLVQRLSIISFAMLALVKVYGTTHVVTVQDFSFDPNSMNVFVGDTVKFQWVSGSHTTTSNGVPTNAFPWNSSISAATPTFSYPVSQIGLYMYHCVPHASQMTGQFFASINPNGVQAINPYANSVSVLTNPLIDQVSLSINLTEASQVRISIYDLMGKEIKVLANEMMPAGTAVETYYLDAKLQPGYYFIATKVGDASITKKVVVE